MTREANSSLSQTMEAMLQQESVYYNYSEVNNNSDTSLHTLIPCLENIQELCRLRHRETLVIATSYISRYLQSNTPSSSSSLSRVALVCFYMACKIHEPAALPLRTLSDLHQRFFPQTQTTTQTTTCLSWEQLELDVCSALAWRLHPPMASAFVDQFLPEENTNTRKLRRKAQSCLEAVFKAQPCAYVEQHKPSALAMAALVLAQKNKGRFCADQRSLAFLKDHRRANTPLSPTPPKKTRKRCVTPTPPSPPTEPSCKRMRQTTTLSPCLISTRSSCLLSTLTAAQPMPCLLWKGSPRSALTMAE